MRVLGDKCRVFVCGIVFLSERLDNLIQSFLERIRDTHTFLGAPHTNIP